MLYMSVRYASPSGTICYRCPIVTLSGHVELFLTCVVVSVVCLMVDCVSELFVECVCYLCGCGDCFLFEIV